MSVTRNHFFPKMRIRSGSHPDPSFTIATDTGPVPGSSPFPAAVKLPTGEASLPIAIAGLSHHIADGDGLEAFRFPDEPRFLRDANLHFPGVILLQTCNRTEVIVEGNGQELTRFLEQMGRTGFTVSEKGDALLHLFELSAGIDSMIIGEDQILGQLRRAMVAAQEAGCCSDLLELCVTKAVHAGIKARRLTGINRGAVSVGSAAVFLAEQQLGTLSGKQILVIGSGEMGMLVAQALSEKNLTAIYVANRTFDRAEVLAKKIGGRAVNFKEIEQYIARSDVVISCTSARHPILRKSRLEAAMDERRGSSGGGMRPLILIDIAQPRDIEPGAGAIDGVRLFTMDDLRDLNNATMKNRRREKGRAQEFLKDELDRCLKHVSRRSAGGALASLRSWAETIRVRERDRAIARLGKRDERTIAVVEDLTRVLVNRILADTTIAIRSCAERGDLSSAEEIVRAITRGEHGCLRNSH